jgi:oxygen-independent coproporphyrinogen-3 oxidase
MSDVPNSLGIYIQVPFCRTKCTYCNFHTGVFSKAIYAPYVDAVVHEITGHEQLYRNAKLGEQGSCGAAGGRVVDTVYIGGGTPSLLEPAALGRMLDALRGSFACALAEVTLEADPETITREKADAWLASGINRVSLGTQSFVDRELAAAGRLHRRDDIYRCVETLRNARLANFSFDLIAGLPHQTSESWQTSLDEVCGLSPSHVSVYMLEIDEGSRLGRESLAGGARYSVPSLPEDDDTASFYEHACEQLAAFGYEHYEISNWALPGKRSAHNLKYWERAPYLGFGAGAHSFDGSQRWANAHDPAAYTAAIAAGRLPIEQLEPVSKQAALDEELFLGLRLLEGIDVPAIERRYNTELRDRVAGLVEQGLVEWQGSRLRLAPNRLAISNEVFVELLS